VLQKISERKFYVAARGVSTVASLILALIYSQDLGIINRSILAFVMTVNSLSWILLTSGSTLTLRKLGADSDLRNYLPSFVSLFFTQAILVLAICVITIQVYSNFKVNLPTPLFWTSLVYVLCSGLHLISIEVLTAMKRFKLVGWLEILTIFLQFSIYFCFKIFTDISIAISLFLSISLSYAIIFQASLFIALKSNPGKVHIESPKHFWREAKGNHSLGPVFGIMDRSDRVLIGFFLETPVLGAYAVFSSLITVVRFIPDALARISLARQDWSVSIPRRGKVVTILTITAIVLLVVELARIFISGFLGSQWLISYFVCVLMAIQELLRGWYQIVANRLIARGFSVLTHRTNLLVPAIALIACLLSLRQLGLIAVPITFSAGYLIGIWVLGKLK
jgi:hypothetical protein